MFAGDGADAPGHLRAADGVDLVAVALGSQPETLRRHKDASAFLGREHARLAEHVAELRQMLLSHLGQHLVDDEPDIPLPILGILLGQGVGRHKGADQLHGLAASQQLHGAEHLQLLLGTEAVAGLALAGGDAQAEHLAQLLFGLVGQLLHGSRPGLLHRGKDAAARRQDLQVRDALQLHC